MKRFTSAQIFYNPHKLQSFELAEQVAASLTLDYGLRAEVRLTTEFDPDALDENPVFITVGGDGTMLRTARLGAEYDVPVLGINLGRIGFLLEVPADNWQPALQKLIANDYWLEHRMLVKAEHRRQDKVLAIAHALNEVVVTRGALARPVHLETYIDEASLTTYVADGVIVATPTGSTAYALAAGGPILPPQLQNMVIIPVAPHLSVDRAIVLDHGTVVDMIVRTDHHAIMSADGQTEIELQSGDQIRVQASKQTAKFIRMQDRSYFYRNITARLVFKEQN